MYGAKKTLGSRAGPDYNMPYWHCMSTLLHGYHVATSGYVEPVTDHL